MDVQLGIFRMMVPPISKATIFTASPTDFSSVVFSVERSPKSFMMMVEKELTTPFGIALWWSAFSIGDITTMLNAIRRASGCVRCEHADEKKYSLGVFEYQPNLVYVEVLVLDAGPIPGNSFDRDEFLAVVQKLGVRGRVGEDEPDDRRPKCCETTQLSSVMIQSV